MARKATIKKPWDNDRIAAVKQMAKDGMSLSEAARELKITSSALRNANDRYGPLGFPRGKEALRIAMKKRRADPKFIEAHREASRQSLMRRNQDPVFRARVERLAADARAKRNYDWQRKGNLKPETIARRNRTRAKKQLIARGITPIEIMVPA